MVEIGGNVPPQGTVGDLYTFTITATGVNQPYQWVADGTLPAGLHLDPDTATLSGRLAEAGTYPFTVRVTDTAGGSESRGFIIIVNAKLTILDDMSPSGGPSAAQATVVAELRADGGIKPYQWAVAPGSRWPEGLPQIDPDTGRIYGRPDRPGETTVRIQVLDAAHHIAVADFVIKARPTSWLRPAAASRTTITALRPDVSPSGPSRSAGPAEKGHNTFLGGITFGWLTLAAAAGVLGLVIVSSEIITNRTLLEAVALAGAAGGCLPGGAAVGSYVGNRAFKASWTAYFSFRPVLGAAVAVLLYFGIRALIVSSNAPVDALNHYGILAFAFLSGLFSKGTLDRLLEISDAIVARSSGLSAQFERQRNPPRALRELDPYHGFIVHQVSRQADGASRLLRIWLQPNEPSDQRSQELISGEGPAASNVKFRFTVFQHNCESVTPQSASITVGSPAEKSEQAVFTFDAGDGMSDSFEALVEVSQHGRTVAVVNARDSHS